MELLLEYGLFLAKLATALVVFLVLLGTLTSVLSRSRDRRPDRLVVRKLNDRFRRMEKTLRRVVEPHGNPFQRLRARLQRHAKTVPDSKPESAPVAKDSPARPRVYVLHFSGDIRASSVDSLREEITAILTLARAEQDRVVVCLESPGGLVPSYGLAAAQLARLREAKLDLTVVVDRVAASGGYMMAAVAHRIVAAPFAVLGSIGVVAQIPNLHRWLARHDIDVELLTAGEHKRTLTVLGENTDEGRRKFRAQIEDAHELFKDFLARYRPQLDLEKVATGEHWYGERARELGLADELRTSDDLLLETSREADLFEVTYIRPQTLGRRVTLAMESLLERALHNLSFQGRP